MDYEYEDIDAGMSLLSVSFFLDTLAVDKMVT